MVIATFVWGTYFVTAIRRSAEDGAAEWGAAISSAGLVVALFAPVLGAIADRGGERKPWIGFFGLLCVITTSFLWFSNPQPSAAVRTLIFVAVGSVSYEFGLVFYNAMLRDIISPRYLGRLSGWGWGAGYVGGLACLGLALFALIKAPTPPFGLEKSLAEPVRATGVLVALWIVIFAIPLFVFVPDRNRVEIGAGRVMREGLASLYASLRRLPKEPHILRFLLARMVYGDGLNTLFIFGGIYAAGAAGFSLEEVVTLGVAINATAGAGALLFAWVDDWLGSKPTIVSALLALIGIGAAILLTHSKLWFWILALALGVFIGPAQAASRTLMARMAPAGLEAEMFGLYALSGKITAFMGPALYGWATSYFASLRAGMASVVIFIAVGLALLLTVKAPSSSRVSS